MKEIWFPKVGDKIMHKKSKLLGKLVDWKDTKANIYVTDSTGGYHIMEPELYNWELDNSSCTSPSPLSLSSVEEITKPVRYNKKGKLECWDVILDQEMDFLEGSILKYLWRYKQKNGVHDLEKAKVYIDKIIQGLKNEK
jgi:hypothetical protein